MIPAIHRRDGPRSDDCVVVRLPATVDFTTVRQLESLLRECPRIAQLTLDFCQVRELDPVGAWTLSWLLEEWTRVRGRSAQARNPSSTLARSIARHPLRRHFVTEAPGDDFLLDPAREADGWLPSER